MHSRGLTMPKRRLRTEFSPANVGVA